MAIMAEYNIRSIWLTIARKMTSRDLLSSSWSIVDTHDAKGNAATDALMAIRADASKDRKYDAGKYIGLGCDASIDSRSAIPNW